jgi:hypothetical protein
VRHSCAGLGRCVVGSPETGILMAPITQDASVVSGEHVALRGSLASYVRSGCPGVHTRLHCPTVDRHCCPNQPRSEQPGFEAHEPGI